MDKRKREILALGLLVLLGIVVVSAMAWYIFVGHNWNKAASHIDDLVGSMDGYTVVVYEGVLPSSKASGHSSNAAPSAGATSQAASASSTSATRQAVPASSAGTAGKLAPTQSASSQASLSKASSKKATKMDIDRISQSYRDKGANVVRLRLDDLGRYDDGFVISKGGKRMGICSVSGKYRYATVHDKLKVLKKAAADFSIVIADTPTIKAGRLPDIDLVVLACDAKVPPGGEYIGSTFFTDSPRQGEVQAVIIAPSGTITAKSIAVL